MASSIQELNEQIAALLKEKEAMVKAQKAEAIRRIRKEIDDLGITPDELFKAPSAAPANGAKRRTKTEIERDFRNKLMEAFIGGKNVFFHPEKRSTYISAQGIKPNWLAEKYMVKSLEEYDAAVAAAK